jgi:parallel beta-helix repeat protein
VQNVSTSYFNGRTARKQPIIDFSRISFQLLLKETLMKKLSFAFVFAALTLTAPAHAETVNCTAITSLPYIITVPGVYCLTGDLFPSMSSGYAIDIQAPVVVIDLNGHRLGGGNAGPGTQAIGIHALNQKDITIKNGTIRGFQYGVLLQDNSNGYASTGGHVLDGLRVDSNTYVGLQVQGSGNIVRNNQVVATGGSPVNAADAIGIEVNGPGARVLNNDVTEVAAQTGGTALGISLGNASNSVLAGNRIGSLTAPSGATYGIYLYSSSDSIVRDNSLSGMQYGIIFQGTGKYMNNMTQGVGMPYTGGTAAGATNY